MYVPERARIRDSDKNKKRKEIKKEQKKKGRNGLPYVAERLETGFRCPSDLDRCVNVAKIF